MTPIPEQKRPDLEGGWGDRADTCLPSVPPGWTDLRTWAPTLPLLWRATAEALLLVVFLSFVCVSHLVSPAGCVPVGRAEFHVRSLVQSRQPVNIC